MLFVSAKLVLSCNNCALIASFTTYLLTPQHNGAQNIFGLWMLVKGWPYYHAQIWMHVKLALVLVLLGYHHICKYHLKRFAADQNTKSHVYFRWLNEAPILLLVAIVILVIVRPSFNL
ncbi:MAG: CopD family protein [Gammaproteobacteria bacterium]